MAKLILGDFDPTGPNSIATAMYNSIAIAFPYTGCFFTKYCKEVAEQLGLGGWVKNSKKGTIVGKIQGYKAEMEQM